MVYLLLLILSIVGVVETIYLIRRRVSQKRPICIVGHECHKVLESKYNKTLGIYNDVTGLVFYMMVALAIALLFVGIEPIIWWDRLARTLVAGGVLISLYFIYIQWHVIKAWCFRCLMSAFTVFLMALVILIYG